MHTQQIELYQASAVRVGVTALDRCRTAINVLGDINVSCLLEGKQRSAALAEAVTEPAPTAEHGSTSRSLAFRRFCPAVHFAANITGVSGLSFVGASAPPRIGKDLRIAKCRSMARAAARMSRVTLADRLRVLAIDEYNCQALNSPSGGGSIQS